MKINVAYQSIEDSNAAGVRVTLILSDANKGALVSNKIFIVKDSNEYCDPKSCIDLFTVDSSVHSNTLSETFMTAEGAESYVKEVKKILYSRYEMYLKRRDEIIPDDEVISFPDDLYAMSALLNSA